MASQPQVLEGTWDEIESQLTARADELRSCGRLRLMVFQEDVAEPDFDAALKELFRAADRLNPTPGAPLANPRKTRVRDQIVEKFRRQGLKI